MQNHFAWCKFKDIKCRNIRGHRICVNYLHWSKNSTKLRKESDHLGDSGYIYGRGERKARFKFNEVKSRPSLFMRKALYSEVVQVAFKGKVKALLNMFVNYSGNPSNTGSQNCFWSPNSLPDVCFCFFNFSFLPVLVCLCFPYWTPSKWCRSSKAHKQIKVLDQINSPCLCAYVSFKLIMIWA